MTTLQSFEFREGFFIDGAFKCIKTYYSDQFTDHDEMLSLSCKLIHAARDKYKEAILHGKLEMDALDEASIIFTTKSIEP
jgi:hypothetical protein